MPAALRGWSASTACIDAAFDGVSYRAVSASDSTNCGWITTTRQSRLQRFDRDVEQSGSRLFAGAIPPLTSSVAALVSVSSRVLWGKVASAVNGAARQVAAARPDLARPVLRIANV